MNIDPQSPEFSRRAKRLLQMLWGRLLTGVVIAVPFIVTLWVLNIAYSFIGTISSPLWDTLHVKSPTILNFVTTIVLLIAVGFMATHVIGRQLIEYVERILLRVPLIAPLYGAVKQMLDSFRMMKSGAQSKRVVYLEYPSQGSLLVGFVTGHYYEPRFQIEYTLVFLPMAPNPLAGFVVAVPPEKLIECSLSFEEASKLIVSGGLVVPSRPADAAQSPA